MSFIHTPFASFTATALSCGQMPVWSHLTVLGLDRKDYNEITLSEGER